MRYAEKCIVNVFGQQSYHWFYLYAYQDNNRLSGSLATDVGNLTKLETFTFGKFIK